MSLIKCPECDHPVSSRARICPNCGVDISGNVKRCPACGGFALMDAEYCPHCDAHFLVEKGSLPSSDTGTPTPPPPTVGGSREDRPDTAGKTATQPDSAPRHQRKSHAVLWYILAILIVALAGGGLWYWEYMNRQAKEEEAYTLLQNCNDPLSYKDFIENFPNSTHLNDVRNRLNTLESVNREWTGACKANSAEALRKFLAAHPDSPRGNEAMARIDSIDWITATTAANGAGPSVALAAYEAYVAQHEDGYYTTEAFAAIAEQKKRLEWIAAHKDSIPSARPDSI